MSKTDVKIAIIGGGASGMTAAITAARAGADVTVYEANAVMGKKICATGNGKCNFTNNRLDVSLYRGSHPDFVKDAVSRFGVDETISFFESIGITAKSRDCYIYPNSEEAKSVQKALMLTCEELKVKCVYEKVTEVKTKDNGFLVNGARFDKVIICCGSIAGLKKDNDFNGYDIVRKTGHGLTPLYPALVQLRSDDKRLKTISGVRTEGLIKLFVDGKETISDYGELLFTDYGISGIPAMQISRYAAEAVAKNRKVKVNIDFFKDITEEELVKELTKRCAMHRTAEDCLTGLLNHKLNYVLLLKNNTDPEAPAERAYNERSIGSLAKLMKNLEFNITGTNSFDQAQVVAGGVDTEEIDGKTLQSKKIPGLYFAGEIIDIDGPCGGYNLQWAWTSGHIAGESAANT